MGYSEMALHEMDRSHPARGWLVGPLWMALLPGEDQKSHEATGVFGSKADGVESGGKTSG